MNTTDGDRFVYVTYIRTTQQKAWDALRNPEFTKRFWFGQWFECDWKGVGSAWRIVKPDGSLSASGELAEYDPPRRMVLSWQHGYRQELMAEGLSQVTFELDERNDTVRLTVTHEIGVTNSKLIAMVGLGWPMVLSSLKSLLETGEVPSGVGAWVPATAA